MWCDALGALGGWADACYSAARREGGGRGAAHDRCMGGVGAGGDYVLHVSEEAITALFRGTLSTPTTTTVVIIIQKPAHSSPIDII